MNVRENARITVHGRLLLVQRMRAADRRVVGAAAAARVRSGPSLPGWRAGGRVASPPSMTAARRPIAGRLPSEIVAAIERLRRQRWSGPRITPARARPFGHRRGHAAGGPVRAQRGRLATPHGRQEGSATARSSATTRRPSPNSVPATRSPSPTGRAPTARPSSSSRLHCAKGFTAGPTPAPPCAAPTRRPGCTGTITTDPTPPPTPFTPASRLNNLLGNNI